VVIVEISFGQVGGSHLNHIRDHDGHPDRDRRRRAASRFGLRPTRLAAMKDVHHFLEHQLAAPAAGAVAADDPGRCTRSGRWLRDLIERRNRAA